MQRQETRLTRRQVQAGLATAGIALLGAGFGYLAGTPRAEPPSPTFDLTLDYRVDPDERPGEVPAPTVPTPTPAPDDGDGDRRRRRRDDDRDRDDEDRERDDGQEDGGPGDGTDDGQDDDGDGQDGTPSTGHLADVSLPPVAVTDLVPGDGARLTVDLELVGGPATLWLRARADAFEENGRYEPERAAGDTTPEGELQDHLQVTLFVDADGDGLAGPGDEVCYSGPAVGLNALAGGMPLAGGACLPPGRVTLVCRWHLPEGTPNTVQTDGLSFGLDFAATDCAVV
jgi:hypothetical protein